MSGHYGEDVKDCELFILMISIFNLGKIDINGMTKLRLVYFIYLLI